MAQAITPLSHYMNSKTPCISIYMYIYARTNVGRDIERIQQKKTLLYIFPEIIILNLFHSSNIFFCQVFLKHLFSSQLDFLQHALFLQERMNETARLLYKKALEISANVANNILNWNINHKSRKAFFSKENKCIPHRSFLTMRCP